MCRIQGFTNHFTSPNHQTLCQSHPKGRVSINELITYARPCTDEFQTFHSFEMQGLEGGKLMNEVNAVS